MSSVLLLIVAAATTIAANLSVMRMIDEMNLVLPPEKRISVIGPGRSFYAFSAYPGLCPRGTSNLRARRDIGLAVLALLTFALVFFGGSRLV